MTVSPAVVFERVKKSFGDLVVLDDFNLEVAGAEKLTIMGPSGSGKSTVLRLLMTLERPTAGEIFVQGQPLYHYQKGSKTVAADEKHLRNIRAKIGFVFQQFNLFPHMTVLENIIEAPVHAQGVAKKEAIAQAHELLAMVGLTAKKDNYPSQLSGGQQQRVAIARTLATKPEILLCDEPTSALDVELVGEVLSVLRNLALQTNMTMIFVTHEIRFAREVSDRIIFMDQGRVLEMGTPETILSTPQHERTRTFLKAVLES
jgi:polar amino acid transport system ATP-binding protein